MARERCSSWVQKPMLALKSLDSSLKYANFRNAVVGEKTKNFALSLGCFSQD